MDEILDIAAVEAVEGVSKKDGGPFGAVIVDSQGNVVSRGHNMVLCNNDPTAHAEVVAIRRACSKINSYDLSGYIMYSSCEPCPMCLSAIIWSNIKCVFYGATREDAANAGFRDSEIYDFISGNNNMIDLNFKPNSKCIDELNNYKGDIY